MNKRTSRTLQMFSVILLCFTLSSCMTHGRLDLPVIQMFHGDMENFVDAANRPREKVSLDPGYLILYTADNYLYLMNTSDSLVTEITQVAPGYHIRGGIFIPDRNLVVCAIENKNVWIENTFTQPISLEVYDYKRQRFLFKRPLYGTREVEPHELRFAEGKWPSDIPLHRHEFIGLRYSGYGHELYARIHESIRGKERFKKWYYESFRIDVHAITPIENIGETGIQQRICKGDIQTGWRYYRKDRDKLTAFAVNPLDPLSVLLPHNYSPEYNGLYVHSRKDDTYLRISLEDDYQVESFVWFKEGTRLLHGCTLYDTTGVKSESEVVTGTILHICPIGVEE